MIWDATHRSHHPPLRAHKGIAWSVAFSPDGRRLVSGRRRVCGRPARRSSSGTWPRASACARIADLEAGVGSVAFSPDGRRIAAGVGPRHPDLGRRDGIDSSSTSRDHAEMVTGLVFSPDGRKLISSGTTGPSASGTPRAGARSRSPQGHKFLAHGVADQPRWPPHRLGGSDQTVKLWDADTGQQLIDPARPHRPRPVRGLQPRRHADRLGGRQRPGQDLGRVALRRRCAMKPNQAPPLGLAWCRGRALYAACDPEQARIDPRRSRPAQARTCVVPDRKTPEHRPGQRPACASRPRARIPRR